jgi:hypothetical protein
MRNILAASLIVSLLTPSFAMAAVTPASGGEYSAGSNTAPGSDTPLFDSSLGNGLFNSPEELASGRSDAEVATAMAAQQTASCAQGQTGGSLSGSLLDGLFGGGVQGIMGIINGIQNGDWGSVLQQLGRSGLGQKLLSSLGVDGQVGQVLNQVLSGNISGALNSLGLGNILGGSDLGGLLGGSGALGGLANDALGGLTGGLGGLTGALGGIAGGAVVPVLDQQALQQLIKQLVEQQGIHQDSSTLVHKECVIDPMLRQFSNQIGEQTTAAQLNEVATGNGGEPMYSTNYLGDKARRHEATVKAFVQGPQVQAICQPFKNQIVKILLEEDKQWTTQEGQQRQLQCGSSDPEAYANGQYPTNDPISDLWHYNVTNAQDTFSHALIFAMSNLSAYDAAQQQELEHTLTVNDNFYGKFHCDDGTEAQSYQDCVNPVTDTPGTIVKEATVLSSQTSVRQNEQAHEVGEMINPVFSQLFSKLLTFGIKALTKKSSNGQGSFLDQISGSAQTNSAVSAKNFVATNIATAIAVENQYQTLKHNLVTKLQELTTTYRDINQCYADVSKKSPTGITVETALLKANAASTTISTVFQPQIAQHNLDLQDSDAVAAQLIALGTAISQAQTADDINAISTAYDALASSGVIHTSADITFLTTDSNISLLALQSLLDSAQAELAQCKTY